MEIIITEPAFAFIKDSQIKDIRVKMISLSSCCGVNFWPRVIASKPENMADYKHYEKDGINLYLENDLPLKEDKITIDCQRINENNFLLAKGF